MEVTYEFSLTEGGAMLLPSRSGSQRRFQLSCPCRRLGLLFPLQKAGLFSILPFAEGGPYFIIQRELCYENGLMGNE